MNETESYRYDSRSFHTSGTRWAEDEEIQKTLTKINIADEQYVGCGVPLISNGYTAYVDASDSHTLILGSTGSKKSRLLIMPTMCTIAKGGESVICTDPKGELYQKTSGLFQKEGYRILVLNLRDPEHSHGWSPLHMAAKYAMEGNIDKAYETINDLAASLFVYSSHIDPFWADSARILFRALAGLIIENPSAYEPFTLNTVQDLLELSNEELDGEIRDIIRSYPDTSLAVQAMKAATVGSEKTYSNVKATFQSGMQTLYSSRKLTQLLSTPDIQFDNFGTEKIAFYIIMPDEKTTFHSVVSLIIKQCYERLITIAQNQPGKTLPVRVNFVLDEFSNLPAIPDMSSMISAARSRNIRFMLVVQSLNQLSTKYEDDAYTIRGNCNNWVFLYSKELAMLQEISDLCGVSNITGERLISVSQLQRLNKEIGEALLLCGRSYPYISYLADIDDYDISFEKPVEFPVLELNQPVKLDVDHVIRQLSNAKTKASRNVPEIMDFSAVVDPAKILVAEEEKDLAEEIESYISVLELAGYKAQDSQLIAKSIKSGTTKANVLRNIRYLHLSWSMDECLRDPSITGILLSISFGKLKRLFPVARHYHFNEKDFDRYVQNSDHWCFTYIELDHYIKPLLSCLSQEDRNKVFAEICIAGDRLVPAGEIANDLQKLMELNHSEEPEEFAKFLIDYGHDIFSKVSLFFTEFLDSMHERGIRSFSLISHAIQLHDTVLSVFEKDDTEFEGTPIYRQDYLDLFFMPEIKKLTS